MVAANQPEAFSRVVIDAQLRDARWDLTDGRSVRFEYVLPDGTKADYVLSDRRGRALAVVEAKRMALDPLGAQKQAGDYAQQLGVPLLFLANGREIWVWDWEREAHPRPVRTFFSQPDLERRAGARAARRDLLSVPIDGRIAGRPYQRDCIDTISREIAAGRRKLLIEMATGTGKTRVAASLIQRLFEAGAVTRVLFLVDRILLAKQTEDAFAEYLPDLPAYVLRAGRRFQDEKRITITTLQSMVNSYADYSSGYFDLIVTDECHRSIYGKWSGVLKYFDGIQLGLTATPCVAAPEVLASLDEEDRGFVRDTLRFFELDRPSYRYGLKQAIAEGVLIPYQIYHAQTVKTASREGFPVRRAELDFSAMDATTRAEFDALFAASDPITVDPNALERRFTIPERNRAMVREFRDVLANGYQGPDGVRRFPQDGKTIVFAVTKRHAATLAHMFDDAFADRKPSPEIRYADYVVSDRGDAAEGDADAQAKIKRFKREPFPRILVSVNMLDTGFDFPEVVSLVMARFTRSAILYQQMRGRGTRRADSIRKTACTIFDFTGVTAFHGDNEDIPAEGGFVVAAEPPNRNRKPRGPLLLDVHDQIDPGTRGWVTLDEDGNEIRSPETDARAAELGARFEAWFLAQDRLTQDQLRLLRMVGEVIRADATTLDGFEPANFAMPPFSGMGGRRMVEQSFGGAAPLDALLAGMNAAVFRSDGPPGARPEAARPSP